MSDLDDLALWERDCRSELQMPHENEVFVKFVILADCIGYQYAAFGLELPTSVAAPSFSLYANYAADWQEKYVSRDPRHHGSRVAYGKRTTPTAEMETWYYWRREDFRREAEANGITPSWTEQMRTPFGAVSFFALASKASGGPLLQPGPHLRILVAATNEAMLRILVPKHLPQAAIELTEVERIYLCWVLDGKTAGEIADIMAISKPSVENMQRKLPERFDTKGITGTAFLAYRLGLLTTQ